MMTIEVLIAMVIIFLTIVMSASAMKFFNMSYKKKDHYVDIYTTVLSIKDYIEPTICDKNHKINSIMNGFKYTATCTLKHEIRNFSKAGDSTDISGNIGVYMVSLYNVNLHVEKKHINKSIDYLITKVKK